MLPQAGKQASRQASKQASRQAGKQASRHAGTHDTTPSRTSATKHHRRPHAPARRPRGCWPSAFRRPCMCRPFLNICLSPPFSRAPGLTCSSQAGCVAALAARARATPRATRHHHARTHHPQCVRRELLPRHFLRPKGRTHTQDWAPCYGRRAAPHKGNPQGLQWHAWGAVVGCSKPTGRGLCSSRQACWTRRRHGSTRRTRATSWTAAHHIPPRNEATGRKVGAVAIALGARASWRPGRQANGTVAHPARSPFPEDPGVRGTAGGTFGARTTP